MTLSLTQKHYLQAMGIVSWQVRPALKKKSASDLFYFASCKKENKQWLILSDASADSEYQAAEIRLLSAICQALAFPNIAFECGNDFAAMMVATQFKIDPDAVLLLGREVIAKFRNNDAKRTLVDTHSKPAQTKTFFIENSLDQLLMQPILKSQVWKNLQPIFQPA